ncbi:MAG: glutathione S-transferase family protein [Dokdonella sp.]
MRIYWIKAQAPRRVLALAKHLRIDAQFVQQTGTLRSAEYAHLNPNRKAPTLVDGDYVLWESSAIMAYLCVNAGSDMWPTTDAAEQIEVLRWLSWNDNHWAPAVAPFYFEHIVKATFGLGQPDRESLTAHVADLERYAKVLDDRLQDRDWVTCGRLTIADFQLASMATDWRAAKIPLEPYANIVRWLDGLMRIPAWADPWPASVSGATTSL